MSFALPICSLLFPSNISSVETIIVPVCLLSFRTGTTLAASGTKSGKIIAGMNNIHPQDILSGNAFLYTSSYPFFLGMISEKLYPPDSTLRYVQFPFKASKWCIKSSIRSDDNFVFTRETGNSITSDIGLFRRLVLEKDDVKSIPALTSSPSPSQIPSPKKG